MASNGDKPIGFGEVNTANIRSIDFDPNEWASMEPDQAIRELFKVATLHSKEADRWYIKAKGKKAWASRFLRFLAIVGGVLGALAPIISAMVPRGEDALLQLQITQAGYLAVGIAAGALALDRFSGGSTGWIRYMTAMTMIERLRLEFTLDWAKMRRASSPPQAADILTALECVSVFRKALLQVVEDETKAWATEFQSQMSNLDKYVQDARTAAEASLKDAENQRAGLQVGSINLTITGAWDGEAEVRINGDLKRKTIQGTVGINDLTPGIKDIEVRAKKDGKDKKASRNVTVEAGKISEATIDLT